MSGGHFDYKQYQIGEIIGSIESIIDRNNEDDEWGNSYSFSEATLNEMRMGIETLRKAAIYVQRIDWLVSGDDGEEAFHWRLKSELKELENETN